MMRINKGVFCISIDTELLWGRKDLDIKKFEKRVAKERPIIEKLLLYFLKYDIPVTWAVVGKLYEPGDKLWSGKDIIEKIKKAKIHELASHSYSHEDFYKIDMKKALLEFSKPKARTFIFPRNHINYLRQLKDSGFKIYRGIDETNKDPQVIQLIKLFLGISPKTSLPLKNKGLINIPGSMYFVSNRGLRKFIPYGLRKRRARKGIDKAIKEKQVFHLWFHPMDFSDNTKNLMKEFEEILEYAHKKAIDGSLDIKTMEQIFDDYTKIS